MSADFTGEGWAAQPGFPPTPVYQGEEAGRLLAELSMKYDLAWFDYWASDYAGHKQAFDRAVALMESFDAVLAGLLSAWENRRDLILLTSDHGNMEDMDARGHTLNPVPALLIGPPKGAAGSSRGNDARSCRCGPRGAPYHPRRRQWQLRLRGPNA